MMFIERDNFLHSLINFLSWCKCGKKAMFVSPYFVAVDYKSWIELTKEKEENFKSIIFDESANVDNNEFDFILKPCLKQNHVNN